MSRAWQAAADGSFSCRSAFDTHFMHKCLSFCLKQSTHDVAHDVLFDVGGIPFAWDGIDTVELIRCMGRCTGRLAGRRVTAMEPVGHILPRLGSRSSFLDVACRFAFLDFDSIEAIKTAVWRVVWVAMEEQP